MGSKTLSGGSVTLTSNWRVESTIVPHIVFGPTKDTENFTFNVKKSIPSGAKVTGLSFSCYVGSCTNGGTLTIAGENSGWNRTVTRKLSIGADGTATVECSYKAAGSTASTGSHSSRVVIDNAKLVITYSGDGDSSQTSSSSSSSQGGGRKGKFPRSDQPCYIYDKSEKKYYLFDGVTKVTHAMSLKIEEEVKDDAKDKEQYVNNAKNEPDEITLDVTMSDVYTNIDDLTKKDKVRSKSALIVLNDLKRSRRKVDLITNLMTYTDVLLASIAITQDDTIHFGWAGQLTFKTAYEAAASANSTMVTGATGTSAPGRTPSVIYTMFH